MYLAKGSFSLHQSNTWCHLPEGLNKLLCQHFTSQSLGKFENVNILHRLVYFVQPWGGGRTFFEISSSEYCCSQWRQLYNVEQINQRQKWMKTDGLSWISCRSRALTGKSSGSGCLWADGDSDQRWEIRRWYWLKVKIDLIWNNIVLRGEAERPQ